MVQGFFVTYSNPTCVHKVRKQVGRLYYDRAPCFYRYHNGRWKERLELEDLEIGQKLEGHVVQELLNGKTGPKVFLDVGVGRYKNDKWKIQTAMLRLDRKESVAKKKASRLKKKASFPVYVSKVRRENDQLEVSLAEPTTSPGDHSSVNTMYSASSLKEGSELIGTVRRVEDFGAFVDVGANRMGLLHIKTIASLYDRYIDKRRGIEQAGLEKGARIRVKVISNEKKRLFLGFTDDVATEDTRKTIAPHGVSTVETTASNSLSEEEAREWQSFAQESSELITGSQDNDFTDDYSDDEDDYDEDRAIEDALGLGTY